MKPSDRDEYLRLGAPRFRLLVARKYEDRARAEGLANAQAEAAIGGIGQLGDALRVLALFDGALDDGDQPVGQVGEDGEGF